MFGQANRLAVVLGASLAGLTTGVAAHLPLQPPGSARHKVEASLRVDARTLAMAGMGECRYSDDARIDQVRGDMWSLHQQERDRSVTLTLWHLPSGDDRFRLRVTFGGRTHYVNTMGSGRELLGTGRAALERRGGGGVIVVDAMADTGVHISGQLACARFTRTA